MQSQGTGGEIPTAVFALTRADTPHPRGEKNKNGGKQRAGSPDLGARSKHAQARGMAVQPGKTLGKGQRKKMKPNFIKTSMAGGARWSAQGSPEKAPVVQKKTMIALAKKATNVQIRHAKRAARQKRANAKKQTPAKPAATKRNGVLVLTEDKADADAQARLLQEQAEADKTKARADALAEKQAAKRAKQAEQAEKNRQALEAKAAAQEDAMKAQARKEEARQAKAKQAKARKEEARQAKADKAETARKALEAMQLEPPPRAYAEEFPEIDIWAEEAGGVGPIAGGVGRNLLEEMDESEETLQAVAAFIAGGKASKGGGVAEADPKAREGPGNGGFWKPEAKSASPAKGGSKKARQAAASKLSAIRRYKAGRDCARELDDYNRKDAAAKAARRGEYSEKIERYEDKALALKGEKDEARAELLEATKEGAKGRKAESAEAVKARGESVKAKKQAFKKAAAEFKRHNFEHDKYVMKTNFSKGGGEDGFTCDNHLMVYKEYVALLKTAKKEWVDLNDAKVTDSEPEGSGEADEEEEEEEW